MKVSHSKNLSTNSQRYVASREMSRVYFQIPFRTFVVCALLGSCTRGPQVARRCVSNTRRGGARQTCGRSRKCVLDAASNIFLNTYYCGVRISSLTCQVPQSICSWVQRNGREQTQRPPTTSEYEAGPHLSGNIYMTYGILTGLV